MFRLTASVGILAPGLVTETLWSESMLTMPTAGASSNWMPASPIRPCRDFLCKLTITMAEAKPPHKFCVQCQTNHALVVGLGLLLVQGGGDLGRAFLEVHGNSIEVNPCAKPESRKIKPTISSLLMLMPPHCPPHCPCPLPRCPPWYPPQPCCPPRKGVAEAEAMARKRARKSFMVDRFGCSFGVVQNGMDDLDGGGAGDL